MAAGWDVNLIMFENIQNHKIIPVVEIENADRAQALAEAVLKGGINILEITLRTSAGLESIKAIRQNYPEMIVGAGTVLTVEQADQVCDAEVHFAVAPGLNSDIVKQFQERNIPFMPGVMTPTELEFAVKLECTYLKFFPAGPAGGPKFLRALAGPYGGYGIHFCATGGVSLDNMHEYLELPLVSAIGGSWIATRQQVSESNWSLITQQCVEATQRLQTIGHP
ncbi:MAG: 2-dehydro-3-deoxyphosphogluconate aldolase/(4S)-4-hydroxy-2-oxoglutarate aldolase [Gammaproteobacteria bacterium]|jgi:2-dehydro-3-deoxyphosphogluconate aldolase/(4S)-4-hydroxy-2-oxoglutarate aldolase